MKNRVFIPQQPSRYDAQLQLWVPSVNMAPAERFGELVVMLPPNANRLHTAQLVPALVEKMKDFTAEDWIVAVGDPTIVAVVSCLAARHTGGLIRILKWDRLSRDYVPVEVQL